MFYTEIFFIRLFFLIFLLGAQIWKRNFFAKNIKKIFLASVVFVFSFSFYLSYLQYSTWKSNELSKYFLPPYQDIGYFLNYVGLRFFGANIIILLIALAFFFASYQLNKKFNERFFHSEEPWLFATAMILISHPAWIIYLISLFSTILLTAVFHKIIYKEKNKRFSFFYFWLPIAIFAIIISTWFSRFDWWNVIKI